MSIFSERYSCRNFKSEKIGEKILREILEIARLSPSSLGLEPWRFIVFQDRAKIAQIGEISNNQAHVKNAAALIVIVSRIDFCEYFESKLRARDMSESEIKARINAYRPFLEGMSEGERVSYAREQAHIALASILYGASDRNVASCAIGGFDNNKLDSYLNLDTSKMRSALIVALGLSADFDIPKKSRLDFDSVVEFR